MYTRTAFGAGGALDTGVELWAGDAGDAAGPLGAAPGATGSACAQPVPRSRPALKQPETTRNMPRVYCEARALTTAGLGSLARGGARADSRRAALSVRST